jgi:hypothetical protein
MRSDYGGKSISKLHYDDSGCNGWSHPNASFKEGGTFHNFEQLLGIYGGSKSVPSIQLWQTDTIAMVDCCAKWRTWTENLHVFPEWEIFFLQRCVPRMCTGSEPFLWQIAVIRQAWAQLIKEESENIGSSLMTVIRAAWPLHKGWHAQNERQWTSRTRLRFHVKSHDFFHKYVCLPSRPWFKIRVSELCRFLRRVQYPGAALGKKAGHYPTPAIKGMS